MKRLNTGAEKIIEITVFKTEVKLNMLTLLGDCLRNRKSRGKAWQLFYQVGTILLQNSQTSTHLFVRRRKVLVGSAGWWGQKKWKKKKELCNEN